MDKKRHVIVELSLSLRGKVSAKAAYLVVRCSFTRIDFQIHVKVLSRMTVTYSVFKVVKTLLIGQINPIRLDGKVMNYVFNGYRRGKLVMSYWEWNLEERNSIKPRCIIFNESYH